MENPSNPRTDRIALVVLLAAALYLAFRIVRPYLDPILIAIVIGALLRPYYLWLTAKLRGRATLAALISLVFVLLLIVGPVAFLAIGLVNQGAESASAIQEWVQQGRIDQLLSSPEVKELQQRVTSALPLLDPERIDIKNRLLQLSGRIGNFVLAKGAAAAGRTGAMFSSLVLMLFVLFFVLRDGKELLRSVLHLSPLRDTQEQLLIKRFRSVSRTAIVGAFGTAAVQGVVGGIGLAIVGIPGLFWGAVMAFASLIPFVGTALVWIPATAVLALTGHPQKAVFLALWCLVLVGSIDNFVRPVLSKGGEGEMSTLWVFFAILGGLDLWGLPGLIYGPLVFGICAALLELYRVEFAPEAAKNDVT